MRHLVDAQAPLPEPESPKLRRDAVVESAGGIITSQENGRITVSARRHMEDEESTESTTATDPLAYMSYRAKLITAGEFTYVNVQTSYLDSVYYASGAYVFEELEIASANIVIAEYPKYLYLKVPVRYLAGASGEVDGTNFPNGSYTSDRQTINDSPYIFTHYFSTGLLVRDDTPTFVLEDDAIATMSMTPVEGGSDYVGFWYFLLAYIPETGVRQIHLGGLTLPQPHGFNLTEIEIA